MSRHGPGADALRRTESRGPRAASCDRGRRLLSALAVLGLGTACGGGEAKSGGTGPAGTGAISVQVSGLPAGADARVTVTAPGGGTTNLTGSRLVGGLAAGVYGVSAGYVTAQSQTWTPQVSLPSVTVALDDTAAVAVTYTGGPAPSLNLQIAGAQLIQSTQRADGTVPMVSGRDALLRVFVTSTGGNQAQPPVRVRLFAGGAQVDSLTVAAPRTTVPATADTSSLSSSWNVLIPGARVVAGMAIQAVVDPDDDVSESNEGDNLWPGTTPQAVTIRSVPAFALRFVPVKQSVNGLTGAVSNANRAALAEMTRRMHPLGAIAVDVRAAFTTDAPVLVANDSNGAWSRILGEIYTLKTADGFAGQYVGIVPTTYGGGIAGMGYIGAPASISWDKASSAAGVIAHELGHNFGRSHAPCGGPANPDPQYPYPGGSIGSWGLDLPAMTLKAPGTYKDLMTYCDPEWISDYNYLAVMNYRGTSAVSESSAGLARVQDGLMVWGRIRDGAMILEPSFRVRAPVQLPRRSGPNRVEGFDVAGRRVFSVSFEGAQVADLPGSGERHFAFVLPLTDLELTGLATVQLAGNGLIVRQARAGGRAVPGPSGRAATATRRGDQLEVRWDRAWPLAVIRDARTGQILSFARNGVGRVRVAGSVTVELSEGVSSLPGVVLGAP